MTYPELCTAVYAHAGELLEDLRRSSSGGTVPGMLVFFPEGYRDALDFADVHFAFYTIDRLAGELFGGHLPEGVTAILDPLAPGEECPVCIVEDPDDSGRHPLHVHRVTRVHVN